MQNKNNHKYGGPRRGEDQGFLSEKLSAGNSLVNVIGLGVILIKFPKRRRSGCFWAEHLYLEKEIFGEYLFFRGDNYIARPCFKIDREFRTITNVREKGVVKDAHMGKGECVQKEQRGGRINE